MKILVFGDIHIYKLNEYSKPTPDGMTTLLQECRDSLKWVADYIKENHKEIGLVVNLGDLFHDRKVVDGLNFHVGWFGMLGVSKECKEHHIPLISLVGNHEWIVEGKTCTVHFLDYFGTLVTKPRIINDHLFIPHTESPKSAAVCIDEYLSLVGKSKRTPLIFSHLDILGGLWGGRKSDKGIGIKDIGDSLMINGHHHTPQVIEGEEGIILNVGSLMYKNFKDQYEVRGEDRGMVVIDYDDEISWERVSNPHTSIFYTVEAKSNEELLERVVEVLPNKRMNLKVIPNGFTVKESLVPPEGFQNIKVLPQSLALPERREFTSEANPQALWEKYLETIEIASNIDVNNCREMGLEILKRAESMSPESSYESIQILAWGARNFISIKEADIILPGTGSVVSVTGVNMDSTAADNNGAGKSSLFEIIPYTLWGKTMRGLLIDEVIHTDNRGDGCFTYVEFMKGKILYRIERGRGYGDRKSNFIKILVDGEGIEERIEVQKQINDLLNFSFDEFKHLVYLGGRENHFTKISDDTKRKDLLETIIGTKLYSVAEDLAIVERDDADEKSQGLDEKLEEINREIDRLEQHLSDLRNLKEVTDQQVKIKLERLEEKIKEETEELEEVKKERYKKEDFLAKMDTSLDRWRAKMESATEEFDDLRDDITRLQVEISNHIDQKMLKKSLLDQGICDKCGSQVPKQKTQEGVSLLEVTIKDRKEDLKHMEDRAKKLALARDAARGQFDNIMGKRMEKTSEINTMKYQIKRLLDSIEDLKGEMEDVKEEADVIEPKIVEAEDKLKQANKDKKVTREVRIRRYKELEAATFVAEQFHATKLRSFVLSHAVELGNDYIKDLAAVFTDGDIFSTISSEKQLQNKKTVAKIDFITSTKAPSFKGNSSGEKDRMDLMMQLALSELSRRYRNEFNILIVDEEGAGLDEIGRERMVKMLQGLNKVVFLVSQQSAMQESLSSRIVATKESDFTTYEFNYSEV